MANKEIYNYLYNLIAIAFADGDISPSELAYLKRKSSEMGIPEERLMPLIEDAANMHLVVPTHIIQRMQYMDDCIEMAMSDGVLHPKELDMCKTVCERLGLELDYLYEQIDVMSITIVA